MFWTALRHFPVAGRPACFVALIALLSTVVVAGIAYHLVEEPARRRMRGIRLPAKTVRVAGAASQAGAGSPAGAVVPAGALQPAGAAQLTGSVLLTGSVVAARAGIA